MSNSHGEAIARMFAPNESTLVPAIGTGARYVMASIRHLGWIESEAHYYAGSLLDDPDYEDADARARMAEDRGGDEWD